MANQITSEHFGKTVDGKDVTRYILSNSKGVCVKIIDYGCTMTGIQVPDKDGKMGDIILGCDNMEDYLAHPDYFGAIIGRVANRICRGKFTLDGQAHQLSTNNGPNALHGGDVGFDKKMWSGEVKGNELVMTLVSPDGDQNYPGTLTIAVTFSLNEEASLKLVYKATTDKTTIINPTSHPYFNLAGHDCNKLDDHMMTMYAESYLPLDDTNIPIGEIRSVAGTEYDMRTPVRLGDRLPKVPGGTGFDNNFCIGETGPMKIAARVEHPPTGRWLECHTTESSIQLYCAYYVNGIRGKEGATYGRLSGFTLEAQNYPDSINHANFLQCVLKPGDVYTQTTIYKFGVL